MTFNEYQAFCLSVLKLKNPEDKLTVAILGLVGESGEVADCIKKNMTYHTPDGKPRYSNEDIAKELGDVLWYVSILADSLGYDLETIAAMNQVKLTERMTKGTLVTSVGR